MRRWAAASGSVARVLSIVFTATLLLAACDEDQINPRDLSTPKAAALSFARALEAGDADTARYAALAGGIENDFVDALAHCVPAVRKLDAVARAKWGNAGAAVMRNPAGAGGVQRNQLDPVAQLVDAEVSFAGDGSLAQVTTRDGTQSLPVKKVNGVWKVDVGAMIKGQDITHSVPWFRAMGSAARDVVTQIETNTLTSADDAQRALSVGIYHHMFEARNPASQPAGIAAHPTPAS